jgi:hypothetical protein
MTWENFLLCTNYRTIDTIITAYGKQTIPRFIGRGEVILDVVRLQKISINNI